MNAPAIIIEGMDNSGKSTLATKIARVMDRVIQEGEGPPRVGEDINDRIRKYMTRDLSTWLFVRHPVISQPIYSGLGGNSQVVDPALLEAFYDEVFRGRYVIVYCDAMERGLGAHKARTNEPGNEHIDTPEFLADLELKQANLLGAYRQWAARRAHHVFRIGDNEDALLASVRAHVRSLAHVG